MYRKELILRFFLPLCFLLVLTVLGSDTISTSDSVLCLSNRSKVDSSVNKDKKQSAIPAVNASFSDTLKKKNPEKKAVNVKKNENSTRSLSSILVHIAERFPGYLKKPVKMAGGVFLFVKKHSVQIIILCISFVVIILTVVFFRQKSEKNRFMTTTRLSVMDKEVQRACRYIENNFFDIDLSVDKLCTTLVTGKAFLTALFQKELGMTVEEFIMQVRINRAKIMLNKENSIDTETLATATGFSSSEPFICAFVKLAGVQLDQYRKSLMTEQNVM